MSWEPQAQGLEEVLSLLRNSSSDNSQVQRVVAQRIDDLKNNADFLAYLAFVLISCTNELDSHRAVAGLLLKNSLNQFSLTPTDPQTSSVLAYVKSVILSGLSNKDQMIRQTVGAVITALLSYEDAGAWPEALNAVTQGMGSQDINVAEASFYTLEKICEDCPHKLDFSVSNRNLIDHLVPEFIRYTAHSSAKIRLCCLESLQSLASLRSPAISANVDSYLQALFARASDNSADVRRAVCAHLALMLTFRADKLIPELKNVVDYIAYCTTDQDETVALEACEFWLTFAEEKNLTDHLRPYLGQILPLLLQGMVYSEYDLLALDDDEEDEAVPDKETDIKPKTYSSRSHTHESNDPSSSARQGQSIQAADRALEEDEDEDDEDYEDEDEEGGGEWNIRKCSAAALDVMAVTFEADVLEILLPHLKERLFSDEWEQRESGILALGAIAEGCISGLQPHLADLVPWLLNSLGDNKCDPSPAGRWVDIHRGLSRRLQWIRANSSFPQWRVVKFQITAFCVMLNMQLLKRVLDGNKRVQEAGCSAFATLEEEASTELVPFLEPILKNLTHAFQKYQQKNLLILYDALGTLADSVGAALGQPAYLDILMPPLIERWMKLDDADGDLVPLLECLSSVSIAAGAAFAPYTQPVYQRCLNIINSSLQMYQVYNANPDTAEEPDRTFIVVALDLLSGLTQGLGEQIHALIQSTQPPLLHLMALCLTHVEAPIRQSAHALLGDMAISCFSLLKPHVPAIMPAVIEQIVTEPSIDCVSVCNNAAWAAGEIALQYASDPSPLEPFVGPLIGRLIPILLFPKSPKSLAENAAVTIGRLGLVCPALVAPQLPSFAAAWCTSLWEIKDNEEKDSAFRGFCMMISHNPQGIESAFVLFCNAVVKWQTPSTQLDTMFRQILQGFAGSLGAQWESMLGSFPPAIRERMKARYGV